MAALASRAQRRRERKISMNHLKSYKWYNSTWNEQRTLTPKFRLEERMRTIISHDTVKNLSFPPLSAVKWKGYTILSSVLPHELEIVVSLWQSMWVDCTRLHLQFRGDRVMLSIIFFHFQMFIWLCGRTTLERIVHTEKTVKWTTREEDERWLRRRRRKRARHIILWSAFDGNNHLWNTKNIYFVLSASVSTFDTHTHTALRNNYLWRRLASSSSCFYRSTFFDFTAHFRLLLVSEAHKNEQFYKRKTQCELREHCERRSPHQPASKEKWTTDKSRCNRLSYRNIKTAKT